MKTLGIRRFSPEYEAVLSAREPFKTSGSLYGEAGVAWTRGYLPSRFRDEFVARHDHITYTVVSYATPIAWYDDEYGWIIPDVTYSVSTTRQQGIIRRALSGAYDTAPRA